MISFTFTYDIVAPESVEDGDTVDNGFLDRDGYQHCLRCSHRKVLKLAQAGAFDHLWPETGLRDILMDAENLGIYQPSCGPDCEDCDGHDCWVSSDGDTDYETGECTYYALHIDGVTAATRRRIHRLLNGLPVLGR